MINPAGPSTYFTAKTARWQEVYSTGALFLVLALVFFWPQLIKNQSLYWGDIGLYFHPMLQFLRENLQQGRLPLWNPEILCGAPYLGNPQVWPLYPTTLLLPWTSASAFINVTIALHVWFAGMGTFLFLRRSLSLNRAAATFGALIFMFGGQLISKEQFPNMVQAASYLPWILWLLDRLLISARWREAFVLGGAFGLQLLAAHAQMTMLILYLGLFYCGRRSFDLRQMGVMYFARNILKLSVAIIIAIGLALGQLLPDVALYEVSARQRLSFHVINRFYLPHNQIGNFLLPSLHGHPFVGNFSAYGNFWETCCYLGILPCVAVFVGAGAAFRRRAAGAIRFWLAIFLLGIWLSLGGWGHLYRIAFSILPGFRSFHDPARCLLWCAFAASVLAAFGLQSALSRFSEAHRRRAASILILLLTFLDLLHFGRTIYPLAASFPAKRLLPVAATVDASQAMQSRQARFLSPDSERIWRSFTGHRSYGQGVPHYQDLWMDTLCSNLMMERHLYDAYGYEPMTERTMQLIAGTAANTLRPDATPQELSAAATWSGLLSVRYIATCREFAPESTWPGLQPVLSDPTLPPSPYSPADRLYLSRNTLWQPRARVTANFICVPSSPQALTMMTMSLLKQNSLDLARRTVLTGQTGFASTRALSPSRVTLTDNDPDRVAITTRTPQPSVLVLADTLSPGWHATVDGRSVEILPADYALRAVPLPSPGDHRILFRYQPTPFLLGLYGTLLTMSFLFGASVWHYRIKKRPPL